MTSNFSDEVQEIIGPVLADRGFVLDGIDDGQDRERGGDCHIVYYRSSDCKIQVYKSSREGETNCMIAPLDAPNSFGLRTKKWQYITRFAKRPDLPMEELLIIARAKYESFSNPLEWVRDLILTNYDEAHYGILKMYPKTNIG